MHLGKCQCGYFFIDGLSGPERANLGNIGIHLRSESGINIISVTCDGPSCQFSMLSELGASLHPPELQTSFPHPIFDNERVYVIISSPHSDEEYLCSVWGADRPR